MRPIASHPHPSLITPVPPFPTLQAFREAVQIAEGMPGGFLKAPITQRIEQAMREVRGPSSLG